MIKIDLYGRTAAAFLLSRAISSYLGMNMKLYEDQTQRWADVKFIYGQTEYNFSAQQLESGSSFVPFVQNNTTFSPNVIAPPPMVNFARAKSIVTTEIDNSDFEVVESFGKKGWDITMAGIIVDMENHWYPSEAVAKLIELFDIDDTLQVVGDMFADLGIKEVYITEITDISPVEGYNDTIKYVLKLRSTRPQEENLF